MIVQSSTRIAVTFVASAGLALAVALAGCGKTDATPKAPAGPAQAAIPGASIPGPLPEPPIPTGPMTVQQELASVLFNVCLPASRGGSPLTAGSAIMKALGNPAVVTNDETGETMSTFTTPRGLTVYLVPGTGHCEVSSSGLELPDDTDLFTALDPLVEGWTLQGEGVLGSPDYRFAIVESVRYGGAEFNRFSVPPAVVKAHFDRIDANAALPYPAALKQVIAACPRFLAIAKMEDGAPQVDGFDELSELGGWSSVGGTSSLQTDAGSLDAVDGHCEITNNWDTSDPQATRESVARMQAAKAALSDGASGWRAAGADAWTAPDGSRVAYQQEAGSARFTITPKA
ncbi:hypothetical protein BH10PSE2_BH10PSE2_08550 [soil metagenome]